MTQQQLLSSFSALGNELKQPELNRSALPVSDAIQSNGWFTPESIAASCQGIIHLLEKGKLEAWISKYPFNRHSKTIGVIMAGNLPMVGFHDLLSVLISGHRIEIKLSSKDSVLIPFLVSRLIEIEPLFEERIEFMEQLKGFEAVIATGSDNSSNYFFRYFSKYPHIIRKNRTSCAVLTMDDRDEDLKQLGTDIFSYYGLGCRNVSKIYLPEDFDPKRLIALLEPHAYVINNNKYVNNYDYNRSIYLVNKEPHYDNGFFILKESTELASPISVVYFERYAHFDSVKNLLNTHKEKIQCIVAGSADLEGSVPFGRSQTPELWDYADNVDTMEFLSAL